MSKTFDMTKELDEYSRNARTALMWVYPPEVRSILEKTIELQVETSKFINKTTVEMFNKITSTATTSK